MEIAVLGARGAIGRACVHELHRRNIQVIELDSNDEIPERLDVLLLAVPPEIAKNIAFTGTVIDCSRAAPNTLLSLPGVLDVVATRKRTPNCMASLIAQAVASLNSTCNITSLVATTMQCASGAGWKGIQALQRCDTVSLFGGHLENNIIPHENAIEEEDAIAEDLNELLGCAVTATSFRVPVHIGHVASIRVETHKPINPQCLPESKVFDPRSMEGQRNVAIGRVRIDKNTADFIVCGDQLVCGTAIPAVESIFFT